MIKILLPALLLVSPLFAESDAIGEKLSKTKTLYAQEVAAIQKKSETWFGSREDAARNAGNKKLLDQIKAERATFMKSGELPASAPGDYKKQLADSKNRLLKAYEEAIKTYVRAKEDKQADIVDKELALVKTGVDPIDPRRLWVHEKGEFRIFKKDEWAETTPDGGKLHWQEIDRNKNYIELTVFTGGRRHFIRLHEGSDGRRSENEKEYTQVFTGKWVK